MTETSPTASPTTLSVAICTFRRPEMLADLLRALAAVTAPDGCSLDVMVFDNDPHGSAKPVVDAHGGATARPPVSYVHVGAGDISKVRNAALEATLPRSAFVALIDDDEVPTPRWLVELVAAQRRWNAGVVIGPVLGVVPASCPSWIRDGGYFDVVSGTEGEVLHEGITGNALLRSDVVAATGLRFEESFGLSGGEDQLFFRRLVKAGVEIRYAADAVVHETVPASRCTAAYLVKRSLRTGNTLGLLDGWEERGPRTVPVRVVKAGAWMATGALRSVGDALRRRSPWHGALRVVRGVGMLTGLAHYRYEMYR